MADSRRAAIVLRCRACGVELAPAARFCRGCGALTAVGARGVVHEGAAERRRSRQVVRGLALPFLGVFVALLLEGWLDGRGASMVLVLAAGNLAMAGAGWAGLWALGPGSWRSSLGRRPGVDDFGLAVLGGLLALALSAAYVLLLAQVLPPSEVEAEVRPALPWLVLSVVVLPPLVEEWLCRGVIWQAARAATGVLATVCLTAFLFACLHALNGAAWLELPHRFVAGLVFGWLRARSGSLLPPVVAHATLNGFAVLLG